MGNELDSAPQREKNLTAQSDETELDSSRMPLWEHLDDLRKAIIRVLLVVSLATCVTYRYADQILFWLEKPLLDALPAEHRKLYFTGITDKFFVYLKAAIYAGIAITAPYLLWEIWRFVSPGLYKKEKRMVFPFIFLGTVFFVIGVLFGYFIVVPHGYDFLVNFGATSNASTEMPLITLAEYFTLTLQLLLMMGAVFELPVILMILAKFGIVNSAFLSKMRGQAYVGLAVLAAFITPTPDAFTMVLVLFPLCLLFELSVILVNWVGKPT